MSFEERRRTRRKEWEEENGAKSRTAPARKTRIVDEGLTDKVGHKEEDVLLRLSTA